MQTESAAVALIKLPRACQSNPPNACAVMYTLATPQTYWATLSAWAASL